MSLKDDGELFLGRRDYVDPYAYEVPASKRSGCLKMAIVALIVSIFLSLVGCADAPQELYIGGGGYANGGYTWQDTLRYDIRFEDGSTKCAVGVIYISEEGITHYRTTNGVSQSTDLDPWQITAGGC